MTDDLKGQAACNEVFNEPSPGYVTNAPERAPGFLIPTSNGLWREAKFIRQLLEGQIAGFAAATDQCTNPFIGKLYATP